MNIATTKLIWPHSKKSFIESAQSVTNGSDMSHCEEDDDDGGGYAFCCLEVEQNFANLKKKKHLERCEPRGPSVS
jgi:hypothetical protein